MGHYLIIEMENNNYGGLPLNYQTNYGPTP